MSTVPNTLPSVLMAESRPTVPPTSATAEVSTRITNGPTVASSVNGTKKRNSDASSEPTARGNCRQANATFAVNGTVPARYTPASRMQV